MNLYARFRNGTCRRLHSIMAEAPWSNHDLLSGFILLFIGLLLLYDPEIYTKLRTLNFIAQKGYTEEWSGLFLFSGIYGVTVTLWCLSPPFLIRITARMFYAFCFLTLAFSSFQFSTTPSAITFSMIAIWSVWGILRTQTSGR